MTTPTERAIADRERRTRASSKLKDRPEQLTTEPEEKAKPEKKS